MSLENVSSQSASGNSDESQKCNISSSNNLSQLKEEESSTSQWMNMEKNAKTSNAEDSSRFQWNPSSTEYDWNYKNNQPTHINPQELQQQQHQPYSNYLGHYNHYQMPPSDKDGGNFRESPGFYHSRYMMMPHTKYYGNGPYKSHLTTDNSEIDSCSQQESTFKGHDDLHRDRQWNRPNSYMNEKSPSTNFNASSSNNKSSSRKPRVPTLQPYSKKMDILNEFADLSTGPHSPLCHGPTSQTHKYYSPSVPSGTNLGNEWWKSGGVDKFFHQNKPLPNILSPLVNWVLPDASNRIFNFDSNLSQNSSFTRGENYNEHSLATPSIHKSPTFLFFFGLGSKIQITQSCKPSSDKWIEVTSSLSLDSNPSYVLFKDSLLFKGGLRIISIEFPVESRSTEKDQKIVCLGLKSMDEDLSSFTMNILSPMPLDLHIHDKGFRTISRHTAGFAKSENFDSKFVHVNDIVTLPSPNTFPIHPPTRTKTIGSPSVFTTSNGHSDSVKQNHNYVASSNSSYPMNTAEYPSSGLSQLDQKAFNYYDPANANSPSSSQKLETCEAQKRPMNGFMLFAKTYRLQLINSNPGKDNRHISVLLGEKWRSLPGNERVKYCIQAKEMASKRLEENPLCWKRKNQVGRNAGKKRKTNN